MAITFPPQEKSKANSRALGDDAEKLALCFLQARGFRLVIQNFSCKHGEIDLIVQQDKVLVFVEVRYRKSRTFGDGAESVDLRKQKKLIKTAEFFLQQNVIYRQCPCRFDIVSIGPASSDINWITNAIET